MKRKESSTNRQNQIVINDKCNIAYTLGFIEGRWKPTVLWLLLRNEPLRFSQLKKMMPDISERMLTSALKELEKDGILQRITYPEVPPRVEYLVTPQGKSLTPVLEELEKWGAQHKNG
ncbi:MAG: helix-turn-helix transcriptional regulator [Chitinophagaceae bacterium]|nr:helix-turn-helix transcriptional regulator [Chitinophagaceae bacterium]